MEKHFVASPEKTEIGRGHHSSANPTPTGFLTFLFLIAVVLAPQVAQAVCPDCSSVWPPEPGQLLTHTAAFANDPGLPPLTLSESLKFADVDGDGRADACAHDGTSITCHLHRQASGEYSCGLIGSATQTTAGFGPTWLNTPDHWQTIQYPDVDDDGRADVCGRGNDGIYCATGASSFSDTSLWLADFNNAGGWDSDPAYWSTIQFPDVNGDGRSDVCGRGIFGIYCAVSNGSSFIGMGQWSNAFGDGDGWNANESLYGTIQFADVNDDGADDICGRGTAGVYCARSRPLFNDFEAPALWTAQFATASGWESPEYYKTIRLADINGDGNADICGRGGAGLYCGISVGTEFQKADELNLGDFSNANGWDQPEYYETIFLADMNGDQRADACGRHVDGIICALATPYFTGLLSNYTNLFEPASLWTEDFGDNKNWGLHEQYWGTVQPALVFGSEPGAVICGRSAAGIRCQNPWTMQVVPDYLPQCNPWTPSPTALGDLKTAIVLFKDPSDTATPPSEAEIRNQVFTGPTSLRTNLEAISFGQLTISGYVNPDGDIFTDNGAPFVASANDMDAVDDEVLDPAAGLDENNYDLIYYWRAQNTGAGNAYSNGGIPGRAVFGGGTGVQIGSLLLHEGIHTLGFDHANGYDCRDPAGLQVPFSSNCSVVEYGNFLSQMGSGNSSQPSTMTKARLGWYDSTQIVTIPPLIPRPFQGTYTVAPMTEDSNGTLALRVPVPKGVVQDFPPYAAIDELQFYVYVEYRKAGYLQPADETTQGVTLVLGPELYVNHMTMLIDTDATNGVGQPAPPPSFSDAPLEVGERFTSSELDLEIQLLSLSESGAEVVVYLPEPSAALQLGCGLFGLILMGRRQGSTQGALDRVLIRFLAHLALCTRSKLMPKQRTRAPYPSRPIEPPRPPTA